MESNPLREECRYKPRIDNFSVLAQDLRACAQIYTVWLPKAPFVLKGAEEHSDLRKGCASTSGGRCVWKTGKELDCWSGYSPAVSEAKAHAQPFSSYLWWHSRTLVPALDVLCLETILTQRRANYFVYAAPILFTPEEKLQKAGSPGSVSTSLRHAWNRDRR